MTTSVVPGRAPLQRLGHVHASIPFGFGHGFGLFYVAQAGQPYSLLMGGDPNGDGSGNNDLLYIPTDLILCPSEPSNAAPNAHRAVPLAAPPR